MSEVTIDKCLSCLETNSVDHNGLCESCAEWNESLGGALLALLLSGSAKDI